MALSDFARRTLKHAIKDNTAGGEIADVVDAGSGTLTTPTKTHLQYMMADRETADAISVKINAGTAISGTQQSLLGLALNNRVVAKEIADALSA